jgi:hypothetical protein
MRRSRSFQKGPSRRRLVRITGLLPDAMAELVAGLVDQGCAAITRTLEGSFSSGSTPRAALRR